jgi:hypothetical protein
MLNAPPVPRLPRPVLRRLPVRKAMTIALGVIATDGVVLAADTQLTIPQLWWKGDFGKFTAAHSAAIGQPRGACAITGATNAFECLHKLGDDLRDDFLAGLAVADKGGAYKRFEHVIRRFHNRYVFPVPRHAPDVNVVIGYERDGVCALWQSRGNMLLEQPHFATTGAGAHASSAWLNRVWKNGLDVPKASVIAALAVAVAKDSVDGVGKHTHVIAIEGDDYRFIDQSLINQLDDLYDVLALEVQPAQILDYLGETPGFRPSMTSDGFRSRIGEIVTAIRDGTPDSVKQWRQERLARLIAQQAQKSPKEKSSGPPASQG